jgi:hypothetical protein
MTGIDSFGAKSHLDVDGERYEVFRLGAIDGAERLPFSLKLLLENLLRTEDGQRTTADHVRALAGWDANAQPTTEIQFMPSRVLLQDFTGVPAVVDLAAMREAMTELGGDPSRINPLVPVELVIDHSVVADVFGVPGALQRNIELEYDRNRERYAFLRWGQEAFERFRVVPPGTGIVHQVNLEHLARVVFTEATPDGTKRIFPDTLVGTDSHTTMVNGLGVLGWGVGGIEAEAAMLGQPVSMLIPRVVGFKLTGELPDGATATDLVLTITEKLRDHGVVGTFVEFHGPGVAAVLIFAVVVALVLPIVLGLRRVTGGGTGPTNVPSGQQPPSGYLVGRRQVESAGFCVGVASGPRLASSPGPVRTRRLTRRGGVHDSTRYGAVGCGRVRHRGPGRLRQGRRPLAFGLHGGDRHVGETGDPVRYVPFDPAR